MVHANYSWRPRSILWQICWVSVFNSSGHICLALFRISNFPSSFSWTSNLARAPSNRWLFGLCRRRLVFQAIKIPFTSPKSPVFDLFSLRLLDFLVEILHALTFFVFLHHRGRHWFYAPLFFLHKAGKIELYGAVEELNGAEAHSQFATDFTTILLFFLQWFDFQLALVTLFVATLWDSDLSHTNTLRARTPIILPSLSLTVLLHRMSTSLPVSFPLHQDTFMAHLKCFDAKSTAFCVCDNLLDHEYLLKFFNLKKPSFIMYPFCSCWVIYLSFLKNFFLINSIQSFGHL